MLARTRKSPSYQEGIEAAEELLRSVYQVEVSKVLNPLDKKDFLVIVSRLGKALRKVNREAEGPAMRAALDSLDVDWVGMSAKARSKVVAAAKKSLKVIPKTALPVFDEVFEATGKRTAKSTKAAAVRQFRLKVPVKLNEQDTRIADNIASSQANYIRDEYGRRRDEFAVQTRKIVSDGLRNGRGSREISKELQLKIGAKNINRNKHYWDTVSSAYINRARTFGELAVFDEAGVSKFVFEAVLDERTTDICRFMHGKEWSVKQGLQQFEEIEASKSPEDIKNTQPWVWNSSDENGNRVMVYEKDGARQTVARIKESGVGSKDALGSYSHKASNRALEDSNITMPPLHGLCRSTILPVF